LFGSALFSNLFFFFFLFFSLKTLLGEGTTATVFKGKDMTTGEAVAVKRVDLQVLGPAEHKQVALEIQFLQQYRHPNIIRLLDLERTEKYFYLVLEFAESDLFAYLSRTGALGEDQARFFFKQIVDAVAYLHGNRIAHRDLKLENFVVTSGGVIKVIDFGLSARVTPYSKLADMCGSMAYSPPEIVMQVPYDGTAADIWSLGIVLYTLLLGGFPFYSNDPAQMKDQIAKVGKLRFPKWLGQPAKELIMSMLHRHPDHRVGIFDVQEHRWLVGAPADATADSSMEASKSCDSPNVFFQMDES
jgi:serine/threonine protein kinase